MNKTVMVIGLFALGYWLYTSQGVLAGIKGIRCSETSIPGYDLPNMKTKVPAGANNDHVWLVKG